MVPYESLRGKKERDLDSFLEERRQEGARGRWNEGTFQGGASRRGLRWNRRRVLTKLHNCGFFEGKGLGYEGGKSALVIAADGWSGQTGVGSATCQPGRGCWGEWPGAKQDAVDATGGHEAEHWDCGGGGRRQLATGRRNNGRREEERTIRLRWNAD